MNNNSNEIDELRAILSSLEGFNQRVCESNDALLSYISTFQNYLPNLISLSQEISNIFALPNESKNQADESHDDLSTEYQELSAKLSNDVISSVSHVINDKFTTSKMRHIRDIFTWFSDVSKAYNEFHPKPAFILTKPSSKFHKKLDQQFSKIVLELAENLQTEPTDLKTLNILPSSFPRHVVAFSHLLCRIIDVQQHLVFSEFSIRAENENNSIMLKYPSPKMLLANQKFRGFLELQNELLNQIKIERDQLQIVYNDLNQTKKEFADTITWLAQTIQKGFIDLREENISRLEELVQYATRYKTYETAKNLRDHHQKFEIDLSFDKEVINEDNKLNLNLNSEFIGDMIKSQIIVFKHIKDRILATTQTCRQYLEAQNNKMKEYSTHNFQLKERETRRNDLYQFRQIIDTIRKSGTASLTAVSHFMKVEDAISALPIINEKMLSKSTILTNSTYLPAIENLNSIVESLKEKINEKAVEESSLLEQITETRNATDRLTSLNETIKYKIQNPADVCPRCENERAFVLLTCGHTFCEECYQALIDSQATKCPYPDCQMEFTNEDLCPINWEF
ncbi:hypothetical protein TRFO_19528 [Tritrichomonas foetus]|uniref:RING-type domain-containing protein n=1 Tax=Tritrichomonas foetus TaxID=1144522 RepID=A0A1J4KMD0_9EUKA|nr:hypothetical protein TRFO_19528 [Tritrichomonas foetus]|eukprot:OHT10956.1 hypothetical protein TRFO_19528 [Tritrichomonas foetus]